MIFAANPALIIALSNPSRRRFGVQPAYEYQAFREPQSKMWQSGSGPESPSEAAKLAAARARAKEAGDV